MTLRTVKIIASVILIIGIIIGAIGFINYFVFKNDNNRKVGNDKTWLVMFGVGAVIFAIGQWACRKAYRFPQDLAFIIKAPIVKNPDEFVKEIIESSDTVGSFVRLGAKMEKTVDRKLLEEGALESGNKETIMEKYNLGMNLGLWKGTHKKDFEKFKRVRDNFSHEGHYNPSKYETDEALNSGILAYKELIE